MKQSASLLLLAALMIAAAPLCAPDALAKDRPCKGVAHYMGHSYPYDFPQYAGGSTACYNATDILVGMPKVANTNTPVIVTEVAVAGVAKAR